MFIIKNADNLQVFIVGSNSMGNFNQIDVSGLTVTVEVTIGNNSFSADVEINYDSESSSFGVKLEISIENVNAPSCEGEDLVISSDSQCNELSVDSWKTITINEGLCNGDSYAIHYDISNYKCLESINVKNNSLKNAESLKLSSMIMIV